MKLRIITVLVAFLISISSTACSSNTSGSSVNSSSQSSVAISDTSISTSTSSSTTVSSTDDKKVNTKTSAPSKSSDLTISLDKIRDILSSKNSEVIESLNLSDSDKIKYLGDEKFYVPVFLCKASGVMVGFNGAQFDNIDKVKQLDEKPIFIMPADGTTISFDKGKNFTVGDDIKQFKAKFGEGKADKESNLQGDKEMSFLTYNINDLEIRFTSLSGDDFKKYGVSISKP